MKKIIIMLGIFVLSSCTHSLKKDHIELQKKYIKLQLEYIKSLNNEQKWMEKYESLQLEYIKLQENHLKDLDDINVLLKSIQI